MKKYEAPVAQVLELKVDDVISTSTPIVTPEVPLNTKKG